MSFAIQPLPPDVVSRIAAAEVIDSVAAVVRELVENSLDAGATRIVISLYPNLWRVQVADNGSGMDLHNLQVCAKAHSTSKIHNSEDLEQITSLGFRGEALHSLAQLADVEVLSRQAESQGWRVVFNQQGQGCREETVAIAPGTIVTVSNLFGNWLVRRRGLPSMAKQLKLVQGTIQQIALCHPGVTWQVRQNERLWFSISPGSTAKQILPQILRQVRSSDLQLLNLEVPTPQGGDTETRGDGDAGTPRADEQGSTGAGKQRKQEKNLHPSSLITPHSSPPPAKYHIELVVGLPDRCHRRRADWVRVAVNGRLVRSPALEQTIQEAFTKTLPRDRYPICFVHLRTCPSQIDWNRNPAKTEIYLHSLPFWQEQVTHAIEQALQISPSNLPAAQNQRVGKLLKASEAKGSYHLTRNLQPTETAAEATEASDIGWRELQAVAQVRNTYILAEHPSGVWLVEQHIAHERVLYEQLLDHWQLVPLEPPVILSQLTPAQVEQLQRLNLDVEPFGEQLWAIRTAPAMLQQRDDCADALVELSWGGDVQEAQVATACRSAIRNGTSLNLPEMQTLLDEWRQTRHPRTCPHGRPIYLPLEESALSRFFRRHWVIGKSHGI
ncbi:MAG: DNA mismatch repair endonuclease MutL [Cyanobacteria bacterium QS_7_48_42]|nr:MAG: DNA mismatch repair endonuclease MutL [Cyanobacteria bacterium QS_7_48_42]